MLEKVIFAGFGGQGVLLMGQLLAQAGMNQGLHTSWIPSYGPEMRGGTANCSVIVSDQPIASPMVSRATAVIAMNLPSLDKFEDAVLPGGRLFINSSVIDRPCRRADIHPFYVPCSSIAEALGNSKVSNMVMLGKFLREIPCVSIDAVLDALLEKLGEKKAGLIPLNRQALEQGAATGIQATAI